MQSAAATGLGLGRKAARQAGWLSAPYLAPSSFEGTKYGSYWGLFQLSFFRVCSSGFRGASEMMGEALLVVLWSDQYTMVVDLHQQFFKQVLLRILLSWQM